MDPYKGELMMTQVVQVAVKNGSSSDGTEHPVPILRLLYSFHSSGTEIKQLLGRNSSQQAQFYCQVEVRAIF